MALKIRLRQQGRTNRPFYRVVVADVRSPRDGKYLEMVGWYNPFEKDNDKNLKLDDEKLVHWINLGAQLTEKTRALVKRGAPQAYKYEQDKIETHRQKVTEKRRNTRKRAASKKS